MQHGWQPPIVSQSVDASRTRPNAASNAQPQVGNAINTTPLACRCFPDARHLTASSHHLRSTRALYRPLEQRPSRNPRHARLVAHHVSSQVREAGGRSLLRRREPGRQISSARTRPTTAAPLTGTGTGTGTGTSTAATAREGGFRP